VLNSRTENKAGAEAPALSYPAVSSMLVHAKQDYSAFEPAATVTLFRGKLEYVVNG